MRREPDFTWIVLEELSDQLLAKVIQSINPWAPVLNLFTEILEKNYDITQFLQHGHWYLCLKMGMKYGED